MDAHVLTQSPLIRKRPIADGTLKRRRLLLRGSGALRFLAQETRLRISAQQSTVRVRRHERLRVGVGFGDELEGNSRLALVSDEVANAMNDEQVALQRRQSDKTDATLKALVRLAKAVLVDVLEKRFPLGARKLALGAVVRGVAFDPEVSNKRLGALRWFSFVARRAFFVLVFEQGDASVVYVLARDLVEVL